MSLRARTARQRGPNEIIVGMERGSAAPGGFFSAAVTTLPIAPGFHESPGRRVENQHRHEKDNDCGKYIGDHRDGLLF